MVSEYDKSGQIRRYRVYADSRKLLIADNYFEGWYLTTSPDTGPKWAVYVAPIQKRRFRESLEELATTYLEWFEDIYNDPQISKDVRKKWSHCGAIGQIPEERDLGNRTYSVVIQAAFRIRAARGLRHLGCSCITNTERQGDMIETLLGIIWMQENEMGQFSRELQDARTYLEAACLGVEAIWNSMPNEWAAGPIIDRALSAPHNWYVSVPQPPKIYKDEFDRYRDHVRRVELRFVCAKLRKALSKEVPAAIADYILSFLRSNWSW